MDVEAAIDAKLSQRSAFEIDRERKYQEEQRQRMTVMDSRTAHANRAIEMALSNLEKDPDNDFEHTRMAEGYYLLGDFAKAARTTRNEEKRREYEQYRDAGEPCGCPPRRIGKETVSPRFVKDRFPKKEIIYCTDCKTYAANPL